MERKIRTIGNHYRILEAKDEGGKYFWRIENYGETKWEEIPKSLFDELVKFQESQESVQYGVRFALLTGSEFTPNLRWKDWNGAAMHGENEVKARRATGFEVFKEPAV